MAKNLNQLTTAAASILSTDKMYIARSPFGVTDDRYILGSSIIAQFAPSVFTNVTGTSQAITLNSKYIANNVGLVTFTIPATAAVGSEFIIQGSGAGGWLLQANAGQTINLGSSPTNVAGSLASTNRYDAVHVVCIVANTTFAVNSVVGNLTVA